MKHHLPRETVLTVWAESKDANPRGDMFGGWIMGLLDLAGTIPVHRQFENQLATAAVNSMQFLKPILVGAQVSMEADIIRIGNTSLTVQIKAFTRYPEEDALTETTDTEPAATAEIVYVAISAVGAPTKLITKKLD